MKKLALFAMVSTTAALTVAGPKPKVTPIFTVKGHTVRDPAVSADGRRIYYVQDTTQLFVFDRVTRQTAPILANTVGIGPLTAVSPAGDRLAFTRTAEGGGERQLWTVTLDPKTGLPNAAARRVSILAAATPAFSPDGKSIAFSSPTSPRATNLVVIPVNGGPERVVTQTQGDVWPITWAKS